MTEQTIIDAISAHGAKAVYDAAVKRLEGNRAPLAALGLACEGIGQANTIMTMAYQCMSSTEQDLDHIDAIRSLSKIPPNA